MPTRRYSWVYDTGDVSYLAGWLIYNGGTASRPAKWWYGWAREGGRRKNRTDGGVYRVGMRKRHVPKIKWKHYVFTPRGADREAHGIKYGDEGFLHLCQRLNNGDHLYEYEISLSRVLPSQRGQNVATDWTGFKEALWKYECQHPPKPSVFTGRYQHCEEGREVRARMLHAVCREYEHSEALSIDLWSFLRRGKPEETENLIRLLVLYWKHPSQRPENWRSANPTT